MIIKKILIFLSALPLILIILEVSIRIAAAQPVEDIAYNDIYTERYSSTLQTNVKSLVPGMTRIKEGFPVHINQAGNRDYDFEKTKKEGVKRIAIVGSSLSFGLNLALEDTYTKKTEKELNERFPNDSYEVLLFGRPGFRARETYACIMDEVLGYSPDLIIYDFVQNNYENSSFEDFMSRKNRKPVLNEKSKSRQVSLLSAIRAKWWEIKNQKILDAIRKNSHLYLYTANSTTRILRELSPAEKEKAQSIDPLYPETPAFLAKIHNTESWIAAMNEACKVRKIRFGIMIHPYEMQLNDLGADKWRTKGIQVPKDVLSFKTYQIMKKFANANGIYFFEILQVLRNYSGHENIFLSEDYGHYSSKGHQIVAEKLVDQLPGILTISKKTK